MSVVFAPDIQSFFPPRPPKARYGDDIFLKGNNGRVLLLIHGLTGTPNELRALAGFFNRKGYTVLCPRLANHGASIHTLKFTHWQDFYGSVRDAYLGLLKQYPSDEIFVSGLSMGAVLSLLLADEFSNRIKAVSCLAPTLFYDGWNTNSLSFLLPVVYHLPLRYMFFFKEEMPYGVKNKAIQERAHSHYAHAALDDTNGVADNGYAHFPVALLAELHLMVKHLTPRLSKISMPVQLIHAKDDDVASIGNSTFIYSRVRSQNKELIFLYNSYHIITADQERGLVSEKMEAFFNKA